MNTTKSQPMKTKTKPQPSTQTPVIAASPATDAVTQEINQLHAELLDAARTSLDKAIRIGELLTNQKNKLGHGNYLPWLRDNVRFSERTASRYTLCYEHKKKLKSDTLSDLSDAYALIAGGDPARDGANKRFVLRGTRDWQQELGTLADRMSEILMDHCSEELSGEFGGLKPSLEALGTDLEMFCPSSDNRTPSTMEVAA